MKTEDKNPISYRSVLRDALIEKQRKNPQLSLRSFAKAVGIQSSFLSMVLNGKRELSEETAAKLAEKLGFTEELCNQFHLLLRLEKTQSPLQRERILKELALADPSGEMKRDLSVDQFRAISEWYHLPLQILIDMDGFKWSEETAAQALGISTLEVRAALERLLALELIEHHPKGGYARTKGGPLMLASLAHVDALKKYNLQMLEKAKKAIDLYSPPERFTSTLNLALDEAQYQESRVVLKDALEKLAKIADRKAKNKKLYHANLNLFLLTKPLKTGAKK